ncbi:General substrate transporter [Corchorus capsularis]|uniref:General substrate transporter n=1 Tax=Corchorus capsularis TaxID=210143 RepID=A0A1R3GYC0_COCAP|nr:General substrate transporter [Corchorus capsularis]
MSLYITEYPDKVGSNRMEVWHSVANNLGTLTANLLGDYFASHYSYGWNVLIGSLSVPSLFLVIASFFIDDTPASLVLRGNLTKGKQVLTKIKGDEDVSGEFDKLLEDLDQLLIRVVLRSLKPYDLQEKKAAIGVIVLVSIYGMSYSSISGPLGLLKPTLPLEAQVMGTFLSISFTMLLSFLISQGNLFLICWLLENG